MPNLRRIAFAAAVALSVGVSVVAVGEGFSSTFLVRLVEAAAVAVVATVAFGALVVLVMSRLADWRDPASEADFEQVAAPITKPAGALSVVDFGADPTGRTDSSDAIQQAIEKQDVKQFGDTYKQTIEGCYSCHKASEKPYLRPQIPEQPEARIINFEPEAKWPE